MIGGGETGELFEKLEQAPNESLTIQLTPDYKAILDGRRSVVDEIEYMKSYSTVDIDEESCLSDIEAGLNIDNVFYNEVISTMIKIYEDKDYSEKLSEAGYFIKQELYRYDDWFYDPKEKVLEYGNKDRDGDFWSIGSLYLGNDEVLREAEKRVALKFGVASESEFKERFSQILGECYDVRLTPDMNKHYAMNVFAGDAESFGKIISSQRPDLRELMLLRSYLMSLPRKYRKNFADSILGVERRIDSIDETMIIF